MGVVEIYSRYLFANRGQLNPRQFQSYKRKLKID